MIKNLFFGAICLVALAASVDAADIIYRSPVPVGGNPAVFAAPKEDWLQTVQSRFTRFGGKHFDIVFDGDSITSRWETTGREVWEKRYAGIAANFGIEGDRTENVLWRLAKGQVDGIDPKVVVLMIGTNNIGRDSAGQISDGVKSVVADYEKRCPHAHIILLGIFPRDAAPNGPGRIKIAAANTQIAGVDDGKRVTYLDISSQFLGPGGVISEDMMHDSVHPNTKGYFIWADAIQPIIDRYVPATRSTTSASPILSATANDAVITFSGLYATAGAAPRQGEIPATYQPLLEVSPQTHPSDGGPLSVRIDWDHALCSNRGANAPVQDHTGDGRDEDKSLGGGVMYGTDPFTITFSSPVEFPLLYWTYYQGTSGAPFRGSIAAYQNASDRMPVKTIDLEYNESDRYVWQQETRLAGLLVSKLVFNPGTTADGNSLALNVDDISVRLNPKAKP